MSSLALSSLVRTGFGQWPSSAVLFGSRSMSQLSYVVTTFGADLVDSSDMNYDPDTTTGGGDKPRPVRTNELIAGNYIPRYSDFTLEIAERKVHNLAFPLSRTWFWVMGMDDLKVMEGGRTMDIISELPEELSERVLCLLKPRDLARCMAVSRQWRKLANHNRIWRQVRRLKLFDYLPVLPTEQDNLVAVLDEPCTLAKSYIENSILVKNWKDNRCKMEILDLPKNQVVSGCWVLADEKIVACSFITGDVHVWLVTPGSTQLVCLPNIMPAGAREGITIAAEEQAQACQPKDKVGSVLLAATRSNISALYRLNLTTGHSKLVQVIAWQKSSIGNQPQRSVVNSIDTCEKSIDEIRQFVEEHYETQANVKCCFILGTSSSCRPTLCLLDRWESTILLCNTDHQSQLLYLNESIEITGVLRGTKDNEICVLEDDRRIGCYNLQGTCLDTIALDSPTQKLLAVAIVGVVADSSVRSKVTVIGWSTSGKRYTTELEGEDWWWREKMVGGWARPRAVGGGMGVVLCTPHPKNSTYMFVLWWPLSGSPPSYITLQDAPLYERNSLLTLDYFDACDDIFVHLRKTGPGSESSLSFYNLKNGEKLASYSDKHSLCHVGKTRAVRRKDASIEVLIYKY
ncbi:hypothetical protein AAG570_005355 [Ranatra chinensis]|uniref:F-box domain-containing protein n=1 Tax=Ranatra chinensis TaxID=642074 RepID=A0ABD0Y091_9HEMI